MPFFNTVDKYTPFAIVSHTGSSKKRAQPRKTANSTQTKTQVKADNPANSTQTETQVKADNPTNPPETEIKFKVENLNLILLQRAIDNEFSGFIQSKPLKPIGTEVKCATPESPVEEYIFEEEEMMTIVDGEYTHSFEFIFPSDEEEQAFAKKQEEIYCWSCVTTQTENVEKATQRLDEINTLVKNGLYDMVSNDCKTKLEKEKKELEITISGNRISYFDA